MADCANPSAEAATIAIMNFRIGYSSSSHSEPFLFHVVEKAPITDLNAFRARNRWSRDHPRQFFCPKARYRHALQLRNIPTKPFRALRVPD
jgi:hypothetical protein